MTILSIAVAVALGASAQAPSRNPDTFTEAQVGEVTSLDPAFPYDNSSQGLIYNVYETLIAFQGASLSKLEPRLATAVPSRENKLVSADGLTYRFPIRKNVKFQDGSPLTPEDARYSLLRFMLQDRAGGPSALLLEPILGIASTRDSSGTLKTDVFDRAAKAVRVEGDDLVIRLPRPFAPFPTIMARWSYVMSKKWAADHGDWDGARESWTRYNDPPKERSYFYQHMNGTGPFKLARWDITAKYVLLERNDAYWRAPAKIKRVLIKCVPEFSTRRLMLQAGDADLIETPRPLLGQLEGLQGVTIADDLPRLATDPVLFFTFKINAFANPDIGSGKLDGDGIPPDFFSDPDVRQGFAYAFDYDAFLHDTFKGKASRALGPVPPGVPGYDPKQPHYDFDLKKAEQHLRKAWDTKLWERGFKFTLTYNVGSEGRQAACEILKKGVESLNPKFKIDLRGVEWASFLDKAQRRQMPMFSRGWYADYPDAHNFVYAFYHSQGRYPSAQGYSSQTMDTLIERAARELDPAARAAFYKRILKQGFEDVPAITTVHPKGVYALRSWVKDWFENPVFLGIYYYPISK